jgi:WD40 repeat protein
MDRSIKLWKMSDWKCLQTLTGHTSCVTCVGFSHDSILLASGSDDHTVKLWDTSSGQCLQTFKGHRSIIDSVAFSHDSKLIVSASDDYTIRVWDANSRQSPWKFDGDAGKARLYLSHDSTLLASAADDDPYDIKIWDARNGLYLQRISSQPSMPYSLVFSYDLKLSHHVQVVKLCKYPKSVVGSVCRLLRFIRM